MVEITKVEFRRHAVENGLCLAGVTKKPLMELVSQLLDMERYNGVRDVVTQTPSGVLKRHFMRDGKPVESELRMDKHSKVIQLCNGFFIIHNQYPAEPGMPAYENNLVYA